jgi:8-oxo-dGTP pyrophosphatase MutT (NUDIX family)
LDRMVVAPARPASTVILLRPSAARFEVFLVRRHDNVGFMGGAHVFPGGRVDPGDEPPDAAVVADRYAAVLGRMDGMPASQAIAFHVAASRELFEESGVRVEPHDLTPFARWVTPDFQPKRFDTWFFLAVAPAGQLAAHDGVENSDSAWIDPADAIESCRRGDISLPPPTWTTLRKLGTFGDVGAAAEWARTTLIVPVQPAFIEREDSRLLMLPGDPMNPAPPGFEVPLETRFLMKDHRWTPVILDS